MKTLYDILGVSPLATLPVIQKAYRKNAYKYHPDRNPDDQNATEVFQSISEAYNTLSNKDSRREYDQKNQLSKKNVEHEFNSHNDIFQSSNEDSSDDLNVQSEEDIADDLKIKISLEEAYYGCNKTISYRVKRNENYETKKVVISVPRGVRNKQILHIEQASLGHGEIQDLFVKVTVKKHPLFKIKKDDLILVVPVSVSDAILGTSLVIPTLTGQAKIDLPPKTHGGSGFILKNQGLISSEGGRGNLLVQIHIDIPDEITEKEKQWFKQFARERSRPPLVSKFNILSKKVLIKRAA